MEHDRPDREADIVLRWLALDRAALIILLLCSPLFWTPVPPLVDVPGHIAAATIEAASPGSFLRHYYAWQWSLNLNLGGELLMKLLGGDLLAGWLTTVITTAVFLAGTMAVVRRLNPGGSYALAWALMSALGFPWIWGFLNFLLAAGLSMLAFAVTDRLAAMSARRGGLLIAAQVLVMLCHALGGLLLPVLVIGAALGELGERAWRSPPADRWPMWRNRAAHLWRRCWPLSTTVLIVVGWKLGSPHPGSAALVWDWHDKISFFADVLRDQNLALDRVCEAIGYVLLLFGGVAGARWQGRQALPALAVLLLYIMLPARIGGSQAVDTRFLPIALMLGLGLQDWSSARRKLALSVACTGAVFLTIRLGVETIGFQHYAADYRAELAALTEVRVGSRVFAIRERGCGATQWRTSRLDTLPALASPIRQVWINTQWAVPGLDMLQFRYRAPPPGRPSAEAMVWAPACTGPARPGLDSSLPLVPYDGIDYLWLLDTGPPATADPRRLPIWHWRRSYLYQIRR